MRNSLRMLGPSSHAGLALYKGLMGFEPQDKEKLLKAITQTPISPDYETAFKRWKAALTGAIFLEATTRTPLAIGLGNASPLENGLAIHHTYGTPYLPGSALKGLLRRAADRFGLSPQEKAVLLGEGPDPKRKTQGNPAYLVYWDGWLDPASAQPFQKDVIAVHHPNYYSTRGQVWPSDFDDPNPVSFLTIKPGVKFHIPISCPAENAQDWPHKAAEILKWGLENLGLGGKTNAGYGYFEVTLPPKPKTQADLAEEVYTNFSVLIEKISRRDPLRDVREMASKLRAHPVELRGKVIEATLRKLEELGASQGDKARARALLEEA